MQRAAATMGARLLAIAAGAALACGSLGWIDGREWAAFTGADAAALAAPVAPAKPLAARIRRVRFDLTPGGAAISHEIVFPKRALTSLLPAVPAGGAGSAEATLFVAFTAQARPLAFEAVRVPLDADDRPIEAAALPLKVDHVVVRPTGAPDVDNMLKVIDGLHGIVFENDSQIVEAKISKCYGENPLLRIEISEAEKTGLL